MSKPYYDEGLYIGEVVQQAIGKAKTGTAQLLLKFKVLGTPLDDGSYEPSTQQYDRTVFVALTAKTVDFVVPKLEQLGFEGDSILQLDPSHPNHFSIVGNQANLWCKHETDQRGDLRERWDISSGGSQLQATPLEGKEARQLDALFGKALKGNKNKKNVEPASRPDNLERSTEIGDDDIPF